MRASTAPLAVLVLAALVVGGCGDESDTTVIQTVAPTESDTGPTETTSATTENQDVGDQFYSPTRNIGCIITASEAGCAVNEFSYTPPPKPASCDLEWGRSVGVKEDGDGEFTCIGGLLAEPNSPTLEYGNSTTQGEITCESSQAGITCKNDEGHGFSIARENAEVY